jgi:hypothetical protein
MALGTIAAVVAAFALGRATAPNATTGNDAAAAHSDRATSSSVREPLATRRFVRSDDENRDDTGEAESTEMSELAAALARCHAELARHAADGEAIGRRTDGPWFPIERDELVAMARRCEVREESPMPLEDMHAALLGLTPEEREAYSAAYETMVGARTREQIAAFESHYGAGSWRDVDAGSIEDFRAQMERAQQLPQSKSLFRDVAEERAGLRTRVPVEQMLPGDRWYRSQLDDGEALERELASRLGSARARELRARLDGWPGTRHKHVRCPP